MGRLGEALAEVQKGPPCGVVIVLARLDPEDGAELIAFLRREDVQCTRIRDGLARLDIHVNVRALRKHRRRLLGQPGELCSCRV